MNEREVHFYCDGLRLAGTWLWPDSADGDLPALVLCSGFTGNRKRGWEDMAIPFVDAGFACLTFDFRGWGGSEGPERRLILEEQVRDTRAAITFATSEPGIDPERCGAFGRSLGAGVALEAAARDDRLAACVALMPVGDGKRLLHRCRREWEWHEFERRVDKERTQRTRTGESTWLSRHEILIPDPEWEAYYAQYPDRIVTLPLETAESFFEFKPLESVHRIAPRAVMFIHGTEDLLVTPDHSTDLYAAAGEPKELLLLPGASHDSTYHDTEWVEVWSPAACEFFQRHLGAATPASTAVSV